MLMEGGSVSSLSPSRTKSIKNAHGTGHSMKKERTLDVPGVAQKRMQIMTGVIVEMDVPFQVGSISS